MQSSPSGEGLWVGSKHLPLKPLPQWWDMCEWHQQLHVHMCWRILWLWLSLWPGWVWAWQMWPWQVSQLHCKWSMCAYVCMCVYEEGNVCISKRHAICLSQNLEGDYNCLCLAGYTGKNCDVEIDECVDTPCFNGGTCQVQSAAYLWSKEPWTTPSILTQDLIARRVCLCEPGWSGDDCSESLDDCELIVCENGGTCLVSGADHQPITTTTTIIRESVDSLCRDGAGTPIVGVHRKAFLTCERLRSKPFWSPSYSIPVVLHPTIPPK